MATECLAPRNIVLAFDVYGTLLSTESIAKQLAEHIGKEKADIVARDWRRWHLEYTWRLNSMKKYEPFSTLTARALNHALAAHSLTLSEPIKTSLLTAYNTLSTFPDVEPLFEQLQSQSKTITSVLFSNGDPALLNPSIHSTSSGLAPHAHLFKSTVSVDDIKVFKPAPETYEHLLKEVGKEGKDVWLVSGNPFDVVGARACGLRAVWVDREGVGWVDGLSEEGPDLVVRGVGEVVEKVVAFVKEGEK